MAIDKLIVKMNIREDIKSNKIPFQYYWYDDQYYELCW